jgi:plasmid stabilization system protein ParE
MKISWHNEAKEGRRQVAKYIRNYFGVNRAEKFSQSIKQTVQMIMRHPEIGPIDPLFADRQETYRCVIIDGLSKMVYRYIEDEKTIHIVAFWDCRRNPSSEANKVK